VAPPEDTAPTLPCRAGARSFPRVRARTLLSPVPLTATLTIAFVCLSPRGARAAPPTEPAADPHGAAGATPFGNPGPSRGAASPAPAPRSRPTGDHLIRLPLGIPLPLGPTRPPPLHVEYAQYGVAIAATANLSSGATCDVEVAPMAPKPPCILGGGGGLVVRVGYRSPGPWYLGGAVELTKMDSGNLFRLGVFKQLRAEIRYYPDIGSRAAPFLLLGVGAAHYGNELTFVGRGTTAGALTFVGAGIELELSRLTVVGFSIAYRPTLLAPWEDTATIQRPTGIAQFLGLELQLELRSELGRR
jgi:hypothetical protein